MIDHLLIAQTDVIGENPIYQLLFSSRCKETEERNLKEAENWLAFVNLEGYKTTKAKELSYGQQRF